MESIINQYKEAKGKPSSLGDFKRFRLNMWSENTAEPALEVGIWDACVRVPDKFPNPNPIDVVVLNCWVTETKLT